MAARVAAGVDVSVILVAPGPTDVPVEITLVAEPDETVAAGAERTEFSVEPGEWTLDLPAEGRWRLRARASGYWGNQVQVDRVSPGKPVELRLCFDLAGLVLGVVEVQKSAKALALLRGSPSMNDLASLAFPVGFLRNPDGLAQTVNPPVCWLGCDNGDSSFGLPCAPERAERCIVERDTDFLLS